MLLSKLFMASKYLLLAIPTPAFFAEVLFLKLWDSKVFF
jgi:hypothetical protein